jgi:hypothetical protein
VVQVPGPVLVSPDGRTDTIPAQPATVTIASVLPDLPGDALPEPQPEAALVLRPDRTPVPLILLLAVSGLLLLPVHLAWRRRGPALLPKTTGLAAEVPVPAGRWAASGEIRAVLAVAAAGLRRSAAAAPSGEASALLEELESAAYGPVSPPDAPELVARAGAMTKQLEGSVRT